ncbi:Rad50 domain-containing protein [Artemisia annua]|uniref:Rad50 domain-containing protein n=1 Tax=Artemisia annua TaxID=35608 RepID=A0A2U1LYL5_ARTAN|nr:Rad50 domain-containing protein [Artemisia annua]
MQWSFSPSMEFLRDLNAYQFWLIGRMAGMAKDTGSVTKLHTLAQIDQQVAAKTETKGQIKLCFKATTCKDVASIRSFQLTQEASNMDYKALEGVLQITDPRIR